MPLPPALGGAYVPAFFAGMYAPSVCSGRGKNPSPGLRRRMKAPPRATLSPGRGLCDRIFVLKEQTTNAVPCSRSCCWLSAVVSCLCFHQHSRFVRWLFEPARRRGRACPTRVGTVGNPGTASRPPTTDVSTWNFRTIVQNIGLAQNGTQFRVREGNPECWDGENQPW